MECWGLLLGTRGGHRGQLVTGRMAPQAGSCGSPWPSCWGTASPPSPSSSLPHCSDTSMPSGLPSSPCCCCCFCYFFSGRLFSRFLCCWCCHVVGIRCCCFSSHNIYSIWLHCGQFPHLMSLLLQLAMCRKLVLLTIVFVDCVTVLVVNDCGYYCLP